MESLVREQYDRTAGWGSWYPHNLLAVTRLPDGAQIRFGLCRLSSGTCEMNTVDSAGTVRLGAHAADGSFAQLNHSFDDATVSIAWGSQPGASSDENMLADLRLSVGDATCGNCSDYAIVLEAAFCPIWGRTGSLKSSAGKGSLTIAPSGSLPATALQASGAQIEIRWILSKFNISSALAFVVKPSEKHSVVLTSFPGESPPARLQPARWTQRSEQSAPPTPRMDLLSWPRSKTR